MSPPLRGRLEDRRMITGAGRYVADWNLPGQAHAYFVRSDRAHAHLVAVDVTRALALPGVIAILTGADIAAEGYASLPTLMPVKGRDGEALRAPMRRALALDRVRFVGEAIAIVVAETAALAHDAAEAVAVTYEEIPVVVRATDALAPGAVTLHDEAPGNLAFDFGVGDEAAVNAAFAGAARVVRLAIDNPRMVGNPMELRGVVATVDAGSGLITLHACSQGVSHMRAQLAAILRVPIDRVRVISEDVGGSFGVRGNVYPEDIALISAARRVGRSVKWVASRAEVFMADDQGRGVGCDAAAAFDANGRMLALKFDFVANLGAYLSAIGPLANTIGATTCLAGVYDLPVYARSRLVFSNVAPGASYRGAGRPVMSYALERLVEQAAIELGIDPVDLRRRHLIRTFPHKLANGVVYDCGDFAGVLDRAVTGADWSGFAARRDESKRRGRLRGRGLAIFVEATTAGFQPADPVRIMFDATGHITVHAASHSHGQGHATTFAQIIAGELEVPLNTIRLSTGDVGAPLLEGNLTSGSRTLASVGSVVLLAARAVAERGRALAARALEANAADITFEQGKYRVQGTDRAITLVVLAARHADESPHPLDAEASTRFGSTFPNGAHIAEVEIDPATGVVEIARYTICDDVGHVINAQIVEGQVHGGLAQGAGQVFGEHVHYDPVSGQLLSGSFMDYTMVRADRIRHLARYERPIPTAVNPLGAKGAGEAGVTGSLPALMNAIVDAMRLAGVTHFDMPAIPARVWQALQS